MEENKSKSKFEVESLIILVTGIIMIFISIYGMVINYLPLVIMAFAGGAITSLGIKMCIADKFLKN